MDEWFEHLSGIRLKKWQRLILIQKKIRQSQLSSILQIRSMWLKKAIALIGFENGHFWRWDIILNSFRYTEKMSHPNANQFVQRFLFFYFWIQPSFLSCPFFLIYNDFDKIVQFICCEFAVEDAPSTMFVQVKMVLVMIFRMTKSPKYLIFGLAKVKSDE